MHNSIFLLMVTCSPAFGQSDCPLAEDPVSMNSPTIVGDGTPASCTQVAIQNALDAGGDIICNCGPEPHTIHLNGTLQTPVDAVFDGGNLITLSGNNQVRIIDKTQNVNFTIQNTILINGLAPGPSGHFTNECGGAILARGGGELHVINCIFKDNVVTSTDGSDIAGGAVYVFVEQRGVFSGCTFIGNNASNGGAIGGLGSDIIIANCKFYQNAALGTSGGLRGHGGAINLDGVELGAADKLYSVCGSEFVLNHAEAQGGASNTVFSDNVGARLEMDQCYFERNYLRAGDAGNGGAVFHVVDDINGGINELQFRISRSTFAYNHCNRQGGGIWAIINGRGEIENCTFYRDSTLHPMHGLGGGVSLLVQSSNQGGWTLSNNSFLENYAGLFGGGVFANPAAPTTWHNNILLNNSHSNSNPWVGLNVNRQMDVALGTNIQWPQYRPNGSEDTKATQASTFDSAHLHPQLIYQGGPTPTVALNIGGPGSGSGNMCPATDQRLGSRSANCDLGAFEEGSVSLPAQVVITGYELGKKHFLASTGVSIDAVIMNFSNFKVESPEVFLLPGAEVEMGASLEISP